MNEIIKTFLRAVTPPIVWSLYQKILRPASILPTDEYEQKISFQGSYTNWKSASENCGGYDSNEIITKVLSAAIKVKNGEAVFERDSVLFDHIEYAWPVLAGLLLGAARFSGNLNVLDFGGALGSSYFQNRKFLSMLKDVSWSVVEQSNYVKVGKLEIEDDHLKFYESISNCLTENNPNVVLFSSVLQYLPDPYAVLKEVFAISPDLIILDRTSYFHDTEKDELFIQKVPSSIYSASYPCWFLSERKLLKCMDESGYLLIEDFQSLDKLNDLATWKGHIFSRKQNG